MKTLKAERPIPGNSMQITGGEPMLRDDIADVIKIMKEEGVDHVLCLGGIGKIGQTPAFDTHCRLKINPQRSDGHIENLFWRG